MSLTLVPKIQRPVRPALVLMVLDFQESDNFSMSLDCLRRFTDPELVDDAYLLTRSRALGESEERFSEAFPAAVHVRRPTAAGLARAVREILFDHMGEVVATLEPDVLVTPGWLEGLLAAHRAHAHRPGVPVVAPLAPQSGTGELCLRQFMARSMPEFWGARGGSPSSRMWRQVLRAGLVDRYLASKDEPYRYVGALDCGVAMFDGRFAVRLADPFYWKATERPDPGAAMNLVLSADDLTAAVATRVVVHRLGGHEAHAEGETGAVSGYMESLAEADTGRSHSPRVTFDA